MTQVRTIRTERRVRSLFGKVVKAVFVGFNLLMIWWLIDATMRVGHQTPVASTDAEKVGTTIGLTLGYGLILFFWAAGDIVLGLFVLLSRGSKTIVDERTV